jgi:hypothetical protein
MENHKLEDLVRILLGCGAADLQNLEDCEIPFEDVVEHAKGLGDEVNINSLTYAMFDLALGEVQDMIDDMLEEYAEDMGANPRDYDDASYDDLKELIEDGTGLDVREDVETFHNFIDTHASFINNTDMYNNHFELAVSKFEELTGYTIDN